MNTVLLPRSMRRRARPLEQTVPISAQAGRGSGSLVTWASAQTERVQDWHSLDRYEDMRVNLADHAANAICPPLAGLPKRPERTCLTGHMRYLRRQLWGPGTHSKSNKNLTLF